MTLGLRLAQRGQHVTLFEAEDHLGGLADSTGIGDVVWDRYYHVVLPSDARLRALLEEFGLSDEIDWKETKSGFYTDGRLLSMSNLLEFLRFPPLRLWDKLRLGATIFYASKVKNWRRLERISVADWLRRWSGPRTFEKIWLPLLRAKLGEHYRTASAAFIWATIARMYAARRTGAKKETFGYVRGGYARILERFQQALDEKQVDVQLSCRAGRIESDPGRDRVHVDFENGTRQTFDRVVVTIPSSDAARICPGLSAAERAGLEQIQYLGIVCAALLMKRPLADYYVTNITESWVPFTAVIEMSALVDHRHFGGNSLIYLPKYLSPDDRFFERADAEIREEFVAALEKMYPRFRREDVSCFRVSRTRYVLPVPSLNYSEKLPPMATSIPGLFIVNSARILNGTLNVNETIQLAEQAAGQLLAVPGHPSAMSAI